ncbi:hypothetical protein CYLTODRAFT_419390 [Cylindrobasidium torrendii FP15055 ss-10]|uniref:Uncharacterized protein n=1 Tax=Cylindrobasidium torrendii FP15055 ss-10 TaxID=1314674 RepID=A0A0D7BMN0_9AGAR|nr:hypothetical protein CYLTODRAFT_419390 [Cylindrobasidium torrendii FP15055 ss-10]
MSATSDDVALARRHLGLSDSDPDSNIPEAYLAELTDFRRIYPEDTNFTLVPFPGESFGRVYCGEDGCDDPINLMRNNKLPDGGKRDGIGALSAYTRHVQRHPTHATARTKRLAPSRTPSATPVKREYSDTTISLHPLLAARRRESSGRSTPSVVVPSKRPAPIKVEDSDEDLPPAPMANIKHRVAKVEPEAGPSAPKRVKTEPLAPKLPPPREPSPVFDRAENDLEQQDVLRELGPLRRARDKIQGKKKKTKTDISRMHTLNRKIRELEHQNVALREAVPQVPSRRLQRTDSNPLVTLNRQLPGVPTLKREDSSMTGVKPEPIDWSVKREPSDNVFGGAAALVRRSQMQARPENAMKDEDSDDEMDVDVDVDAVSRRYAAGLPAVAPAHNADNFDENGDFFGRGRDTFQGPSANPDDIDKFIVVAGNAEEFDRNADVNACLQKLGLSELGEKLPNMSCALLPHQVLGVAWMVDKEAQRTLRGGILGDDMGLGKTVQMIALMLKNRSVDKTCKTNLIIAPKALLQQWKLEIEMKSKDTLKCLVYHGSGKARTKKDLLSYDVVITTYQTMAMEWPDPEGDQKRKASKMKKDDFIVDDDDDDEPQRHRKQRKDSGLLFNVDFYRIIADEGHFMRNRRVRASRAISMLEAKYRWVLTGTPIINSLSDVYAYFRFIQMRPWYDWIEFNGHVGLLEKKNPTLAMQRLQMIFKATLMRRMKTSELNGRRLIELPTKTTLLTKLDFMPEEREVYDVVEKAAQAKFNRFLRSNSVLKNFQSILVLLLRLRQVCSHPALIQENGVTVESEEDNAENWAEDKREELERARQIAGPDFVSTMRRRMKEDAKQRMEAEKQSADATIELGECDICSEVLTSFSKVAPCCHSYCTECIAATLAAPMPHVEEDRPRLKDSERPCPKCFQPVSQDALFDRAIFEPSDADLNAKSKTVVFKSKSKRKGKGKGKPNVRARSESEGEDLGDDEVEEISDDEDDGEDMDDFIAPDDEDPEADYQPRKSRKAAVDDDDAPAPGKSSRRKQFIVLDSDDEEEDPEVKEVVFGKKKKPVNESPDEPQFSFLASTKLKYMMSQLHKLFDEKPDEKIIILSQWTSCLDLVSEYLTDKNITHVKYQGDMSTQHRETAVRVFMSRDKERVMLLSLKCGGVGLNLTRANNVISLDLGWSQAVEAQAFDRVYRLGQDRPVVVERLVIRQTVEDRILALQERKQNLADGSLGEGNAQKLGRMSVKEIASLFGLDAKGRRLADGDP